MRTLMIYSGPIINYNEVWNPLLLDVCCHSLILEVHVSSYAKRKYPQEAMCGLIKYRMKTRLTISAKICMRSNWEASALQIIYHRITMVGCVFIEVFPLLTCRFCRGGSRWILKLIRQSHFVCAWLVSLIFFLVFIFLFFILKRSYTCVLIHSFWQCR